MQVTAQDEQANEEKIHKDKGIIDEPMDCN
jgi:hypothetical protein